MESSNTMNVQTQDYVDKTVNKVITQKDLNTMIWRSFLLQASFNYERMQSGG